MKKISLKNINQFNLHQLDRKALNKVIGGSLNECREHEFMCKNGQCVPDYTVDDGKNDCLDASDEIYPSGPPRYTCVTTDNGTMPCYLTTINECTSYLESLGRTVVQCY